MIYLLLNSIALDPNRWTPEKTAYYKFDQLLKPIAESSFHFVEIWGFHILREEEKTITSFQKMGDSLGLQFPIIGMYPKLHLSGNDRQQEMEQVKKIFNDANILRTKIVKIFVGNLSTAKVTQAEYKRSVEFLSEMTNLAKSLGIIIAGETHQKTLFDDIKSSRKLLNDVKATNFKICFQPYNMYDTEQTLHDYEDLRDNVIHVHYQGRKDNILELLEYSDIDYDALTRKLIESGFNGQISIEFVKDCVVKKPENFNLSLVLNNAKQDRDFVVKIGEKYGSQILY
jgi:sugar phosphate isomerase/epimerase